jgi:dynein heavy chain, axonemal
LFEKYIESTEEGMKSSNIRTIAPISLIAHVISVCRLMDGYLEAIQVSADTNNTSLTNRPLSEIIENIFGLAIAWAFGGALKEDESTGIQGKRSNRFIFHSMLMTISGGNIKLPTISEEDTIFDFYYNTEKGEFDLWSNKVEKYVPMPIGNGPDEVPYSTIFVPTVDSTRTSTLLRQLAKHGHPVMFVGGAGTGKTRIIKSFLDTLDETHMQSTTIAMHYFMDAAGLQARIDSAIDKRSGRIFGPPTGKKQLYFIDDLNLPYIETYGTQNSLSLLRQVMDHKSYFDRTVCCKYNPYIFFSNINNLAIHSMFSYRIWDYVKKLLIVNILQQ